MHPKELSINDFFYDLPTEKIAQYPLSNRDESKLLCYQNEIISDHQFNHITNIIPADSLLVLNNTKVIHARIIFYKSSGAKIEIFCLEPLMGNYAESLGSTETCTWKCMIGNAKKWKGELLQKEITIGTNKFFLNATLKEQIRDEFIIIFSWNNAAFTFADLLNNGGLLPLPPYLNRNAGDEEEISYQTVYAKVQGSVAAPTAGLHFTDNIKQQLQLKNIAIEELTLHVGAGTFKPVKASKMEAHQMHSEQIYLSIETLKTLRDALLNNKPVIAVGTTSLRTLESLYWHGVKILKNIQPEPTLDITQWEPYELESDVEPADAINAILNDLFKNKLQTLSGHTQIMIAPGYSFKITDILITNFHQPNSTLLLLVAAFVGHDWEKIYAHALANQYRFLSFGDSSILFKNQNNELK